MPQYKEYDYKSTVHPCKDKEAQECPQECSKKVQRHVHEIQGSVKIAEPRDPHNHRFCTMSGQAQRIANGQHVHEVFFRTDFYEEHFHEFAGVSSPNVDLDDLGKHIHFAVGNTTVNDGHCHDFVFASLIEDPTGDEC